MIKKTKLIPFSWLPGSWGLTGKVFDEAEAHYLYDGEDLERRMAEINASDNAVALEIALLDIDLKYGHIENYEYEIERGRLESDTDLISPDKKLDIDFRYGKIAEYHYDCEMARFKFPDDNSLEQQLGLLEADYKHGYLEKGEFDKTYATAKGEPWVGVMDNGYDSKDGVNGLYFELDWNQQWVDFLLQNGYTGATEEEIVKRWFADVCREHAGDFPAEGKEPIPFNSGRVINRVRRDGGTEYS
jgi:hypothetical protein